MKPGAKRQQLVLNPTPNYWIYPFSWELLRPCIIFQLQYFFLGCRQEHLVIKLIVPAIHFNGSMQPKKTKRLEKMLSTINHRKTWQVKWRKNAAFTVFKTLPRGLYFWSENYKLHSHSKLQQGRIGTWHIKSILTQNKDRKEGIDVFFEAQTRDLVLHKQDLVLHLASGASWLRSSGFPVPWYSGWVVE